MADAQTEPAAPAVATATVTLTAAADATLRSAAPTTNYGGDGLLELAYAIRTGAQAVTLVRFDLSSLPFGAVIDSASLQLYMIGATGEPTVSIGAYALTGSWNEATVTWNSCPTAASIGIASSIDSAAGSYKSWNATSFASSWLANPSTNYGVLLRGPSDGTVFGRGFESREQNESVPRLVVTYHVQPYTFTGGVFEGEPPDTSRPLVGINVGLWGDQDEWPEGGVARTFIMSTTTGADGTFSFEWVPTQAWPYLHVIEIDPPGATSTGAQVAPPGYVKNYNVVSYASVAPGNYGGIRFWDSLPGALPDLVITGIWPDGPRICTQIHNIGAGTAAAGHVAALHIDGVPRASLTVGTPLNPGQRFEGCFDVIWTCGPPEDHVVVIADHLNVIEESDETNNLHEIVLPCDTTPPRFTSGPTLSQVTATSAQLSWASDEPAEGHIRYGPQAGRIAADVWTDGMASSYAILLADLQPATVYHLQVDLYDGARNQTLGRELLFETLPPPDSVNPVVSLVIPSTLTKTVVVQANASDNTGIHRVEFYVGGALAFIDYTPPYTMALDSTQHANGPLPVTAKAVDLANRSAQVSRSVSVANLVEADAPVVTIIAPANDAQVSGIVKVTAQLSDDAGLLNARFYVDGVYTAFEGWPAESAPKSATVTFDWDARNLERPEHYSLAVEAYDTSFKVTSQVIRVWVQPYVEPPPPPRPDLIVTGHTVARFQNRFTIQLTVKNVGDAAATNARILDGMRGFQPIASTSTAYDVVTRWEPIGVFAMADIRDYGTIPAGQSRIYTYKALPVMIYPDPPTPQIGSFTDLNWSSAAQVDYHRHLTLPVAKDTVGTPIPASHTMATLSSDYALVTNPYRLFVLHAPAYNAGGQAAADVNQVLSIMAELAWHKNGVLGYMNQGNAGTLNALFRPGGDWVLRMGWLFHPDLYVLIVGETNIVGSFWSKGWDIQWNGGTTTDVINNTDQPIADIAGDWRPELVLGRIIGELPTDLTMVLWRSIQVHLGQVGHSYDHSNALSVSGTGNGESKMISGANLTASTLGNKGYTVSILHLSSIADAQQMASLTALTPNTDFIYYFQHGNPHGMGPLTTWNMGSVSFGTSHPVVLAASCLTGDYVNGGLAEAFFDQGTGVYIGSTEVSPMSVNKVCGRDLLNGPFTTTSAGRAFRDLERSYNTGKLHRFWAYEYNYYGDPKYGAPAAALSASEAAPPTPAALPPTLHVDVPAYTVSEIDGLDQVEIPGGALWLEPGDYEIPFYVVTLDVPAGTHVQDVVLVAKGDVITAADLHLPVATAEVTHRAGAPLTVTAEGKLPFPGQDTTWQVTDRPDGSGELQIALYPFVYDPQTAGATFTQGWDFALAATESAVAIKALTAAPRVVPMGVPVAVALEIENTGGAQDLIVSGLVKRPTTGEVWGGLMLHSLKELVGPASFAATWESEGHPVGDYEIEVTLTTMEGTIVAQKTLPFSLGIVAGQITAFSAGPSGFAPGDPIGISLTFVNWSDFAVSGQVRVTIHGADNTLLQSYSEDFGPLPPDMTVSFSESWQTPDPGTGELHVTAAVLYSGTSTEPISVVLMPRQLLYLPLVVRQ
jgi:hypothetical protein